ncbi:hypothetical protein [Microvirga subterranea]|uniref:Uncharacterized protein n=1 Tax=Microvirga subterranea TaxID=186651 RepID=A0A370H2P1_9HYPH|nr:hypothetical protein [Microvirga subterranea]RDI50424.1 hypothetical protein DES45_12125 [Microvirga subterranea]
MTEEQEHQSRPSSAQSELWPYEKALAHCIKDFVAELCLTDASIIIAYICNELHANIDDLIESSTELHFKEGVLSYGHCADVKFEWGKSPAVVLDMEFVHQSVTVFFKLVLHGFYVGVSIQRILLSNKSGDPELDLQTFERVLNDARRPPLGTSVTP